MKPPSEFVRQNNMYKAWGFHTFETLNIHMMNNIIN